MRRIVPGLIILLWTAAALAANSVHFGPAPAWVRPVPLPAPGKTTQAALKILLVDHQVELTPRTVSEYVESVARIQTPQGLNALGTLSFAWNPDTEVLIFHKIHIIRGGKVIDVLGSGQKFTIARRETNLAYATLDNTLTAILQPADLQVGDTLDVAYTLQQTDPVMADHPAAEIEVPPTLAVSQLHIRAQWPDSEPIRWHATESLPGAQPFHHGDDRGISLTLRHVRPILQPKGAPLRFLVDRRIDFTSFRSWTQVARVFAPLFDKAESLRAHSPLRAEIAHIRAAARDPAQRAALALQLVENQVRYVFLDLNQGGLVPASADLTWSRRFGDCKAKTVLLLALLRGLKIAAQPVMVNTLVGDGLDKRLPMMLFNHVLVRATLGGKTYWLDGTRMGDTSLAHLHTPYDHWGLPINGNDTGLIAMVPRPLAQPMMNTVIRIDASAGIANPAPFHAETTLRGDAALVAKLRLANLTSTQVDSALRQYWTRQFDFVHVKAVSASYEESSREERITLDGSAKMDWSHGQYEPDLLGMGYHADLERQPGPHQDAPYAVAYPFFRQMTETITLPDGGKGFSLSGSDVDRTVAGIEYRRRASIANGVFTATTRERSVATEFPSSEAVADQKVLRQLDRSKLYIEEPAGHIPTAAEIGWGVPKSNDSALSFAKSAALLLAHGQFDAAMTDLDTALEFDSRNAYALAMEGTIDTREGHLKRAAAQYAAARKSDPHGSAASDGLGELAYDAGDYPVAIKDFSRAIAADAKDGYGLSYRACAYLRMRRINAALADFTAASKLRPQNVSLALSLYWMRAIALQQQGKIAAAVDQARRLEASYAKSPIAFFTAAQIFRALHQPAAAADALRRGLALSPTSYTLMMRAAYRPWSDLTGRRLDLQAALKTHPASPWILMQMAQTQEAAGQDSAAIESLSRALGGIKSAAAIVAVPAQVKSLVPSLLALRAIAYESSGEPSLAQKDLAAARRKATNSLELNNLCWQLATAGVSLQDALTDCNAAIARQPYVAGYLDSRGLVLMRLAHYGQAIASYDSALRLNPELPPSLYGRGICELRRGDTRDGDADIRLAEFFSFAVADQFAHYGIKPRGS